MVKDLNVRQDTIKSQENIGRTLSDINHRNIFLEPSPRVMKTKTKINKWNLSKFKSFCIAKETINNMKREPTEWEKIFANEVKDKGLISKICKQFMQLNIKKQTTLSMGRKPEQSFLQRRHTDGQDTHEKMLNITNYYRNANQNYDEVLPHISQNGHHQKNP